MVKKRMVMDRRMFLSKTSLFFAGSLLGLNCFSKAFAANKTTEKPRIALIIDDIGFSRTRLNRFLEIGAPITFSILPRLTKSIILAEEIHSLGHEIMLHQPMEPSDPHVDPGPGAVFVGDNPDKILNVIGKNISDIPFVKGINNHMGSKFTTCRKETKDALTAIKDRNLFFIDSLTTNRSIAYKTAIKLNIATARRNIFLDNIPEEKAVLTQLNRLKTLAIRTGHAIGIGHPYSKTASAIRSFYSTLEDSEISMVHISSLISA